MDIKLVNLQKNKIEKVSRYDLEEENKYLEQYFYNALGLKIIKKNLLLTNEIKDPIEYLCIDESYRLVIVEKRYGKNTRIVNEGLMYIDYIREHISQLKIIINDALGVDQAKNVIYNPRLVILSQSFMKYDEKAIAQLPYNIEVINYFFLGQSIVFAKTYQNMIIEGNKVQNELVNELINLFCSFGDEVCIWQNNNIITVRKIKAIAYIIILNQELKLYLDNKEYSIKELKDIKKIEIKLEKAYDEK